MSRALSSTCPVEASIWQENEDADRDPAESWRARCKPCGRFYAAPADSYTYWASKCPDCLRRTA